MWQRFTERARRIIFFAQEEAGRLRENYVNTEHLLLGLLRESDCVAVKVLERIGLEPEQIRVKRMRHMVSGDARLGQDMQLTPRAKRVIDLAYHEARELNNNYIGTEHVLLGLAREEEGLAGRLLRSFDADHPKLRAVVEAVQRESPPGDPTRDAADHGQTILERLSRLKRKAKREARSGIPDSDHSTWAEIIQEIEKLEETVVKRGTPLPSEFEPIPTRDPRSGMLEARRTVIMDALKLQGTSLLSMSDLTRKQFEGVLDVAAGMHHAQSVHSQVMRWKYPRALAMIFEKPSLRTRVTFDLGMRQLGGITTILGPAEIGLGSREAVPDVARNLERMVDCIMARVFDHAVLEELRDNCSIPIINALSDREHPCQALADLYTVQRKKGKLEGLTLAYIGDGNNVLHSLLLACAMTGISLRAACPPGYEPLPEYVEKARAMLGEGAVIEIVTEPQEAARDADVVYTDVWTSMGQEKEQLARIQAFRPYQVNAELMAAAKQDAIFMHCLPAHRGDEVTNDVMDGPQSVVFDQAEARLHVQKALLALLIGM